MRRPARSRRGEPRARPMDRPRDRCRRRPCATKRSRRAPREVLEKRERLTVEPAEEDAGTSGCAFEGRVDDGGRSGAAVQPQTRDTTDLFRPLYFRPLYPAALVERAGTRSARALRRGPSWDGRRRRKGSRDRVRRVARRASTRRIDPSRCRCRSESPVIARSSFPQPKPPTTDAHGGTTCVVPAEVQRRSGDSVSGNQDCAATAKHVAMAVRTHAVAHGQTDNQTT